MTDVSVIICCYNHATYVEQALESVLSQSIRPSQLIITDDASTDTSAAIIESWIDRRWPSAEFLRNDVNVGLPATLNSALARVRGDFVVIMAADDWMTPDRLETQIGTFASSSDRVGMVYSDMIEVDEHGVPTGQRWFDPDRMGPPASGDLFEKMIERAFMAAPTVMTRVDIVRQAGPYDVTLVAEDYDMFLRLSRLAEWEYIETPLVNYRVLSSSLSRSDHFKQNLRAGRIRMLRKHMNVSETTDLVIAERTAKMAESLYKEGRSCRETAADLRFTLGVHVTNRRLLFYLLARIGVPGDAIVRSRQHGRAWLGSIRSVFRSTGPA